jgi:hypothetical protein
VLIMESRGFIMTIRGRRHLLTVSNAYGTARAGGDNSGPTRNGVTGCHTHVTLNKSVHSARRSDILSLTGSFYQDLLKSKKGKIRYGTR